MAARWGWLERSDPADRRASLLRVTPDGRDVHAGLVRSRGELLAQLLPDRAEADLLASAAYAARASADITAHRDAVVALPAARQESA